MPLDGVRSYRRALGPWQEQDNKSRSEAEDLCTQTPRRENAERPQQSLPMAWPCLVSEERARLINRLYTHIPWEQLLLIKMKLIITLSASPGFQPPSHSELITYACVWIIHTALFMQAVCKQRRISCLISLNYGKRNKPPRLIYAARPPRPNPPF